MKSNSVYFISLGCAKNLVESERLGQALLKEGFSLTGDIEKAGIIVINTCGFIKEAKEEGINTILQTLEDKPKRAKIVVFGCLVQRYLKELKEAIPEVDLFLPILSPEELAKEIRTLIPKRGAKSKESEAGPILFTPPSYAYLKIADGCKNFCSYCAIPLIRGPLKSRSIEEIISEVKDKLAKGVKELNIIAQDITSYGVDNYKDFALVRLLREILKIDGDYYLRLLYLYPTRISDELVSIIANEERIFKYLDIPLQHCEDRILKLMNRHYTKGQIEELIYRLREKIPNLVLRTSFIVGFPTESEEDFQNLCDFVHKIKFDHLGVFEYSNEEDTKANTLRPKVPAKTKAKRKRYLLRSQRAIAVEKNRAFIGKTFKALVEMPYDDMGAVWIGRIYAQAPEVDGFTYITNYSPEMGYLVNVKITDVNEYDLIAETVV